MTAYVPTGPTTENQSGREILKQNQSGPDRRDRPDPNVKGVALKNTLGALLERIEAAAAAEPEAPRPAQPEPLAPADIYELEAMRQHYAARAGPDLPPDTLKAGLLRGFYAHRHLTKKD